MDGYRPEPSLAQVKPDNENTVVLELDEVNAVISGSSLINRQLIFHSLEIFNPTLSAKRDAEGLIWIADLCFRSWKRCRLQIAKVACRAEANSDSRRCNKLSDETGDRPDVTIQDANLRIDNKAGTHKISISGNPSEEMASSLIFRAVLILRQIISLSWVTVSF